MRHLAGLSQISYVFVYPENGEVVIAGPAEGWRYNEYGMPVGVESGRPTLQLDDLVTGPPSVRIESTPSNALIVLANWGLCP